MNKYTSADKERFVLDKGHSSTRGNFARDRARILHSSALRRLGTKTQVLRPGFDDFVRTRLTHTLEVAQVGRDLAGQLGCSANIVDAACLAHDIGHPPFGHNGETALNEVAKNIGGFEGNAQTLRLITRLEPKSYDANGHSAGLNLTRATIDATIKYPWRMSEAAQYGYVRPSLKFGVYDDDLPVYNWVRGHLPDKKSATKCLEAQVMDFADDVSYCVHDVEDAIVSGAFEGNSLRMLTDDGALKYVVEVVKDWYGDKYSADDLVAARNRLNDLQMLDIEFDGTHRAYAALKNMTSSLIGRFVQMTYLETKKHYLDENLIRYRANLVLNKQICAEIQLLKGFSAAFVMIPRTQMNEHNEEQHIIYDLANNYSRTGKLSPIFQKSYDEAENEDAKLRVIVDQIACLTNFSAREAASSLL